MAELKLVPPCTYQGGKQRIADRILEIIDEQSDLDRPGLRFYDMCCGSGAVSLALLNMGVSPHQIVMCDAGPWGEFYKAIGRGKFDVKLFSDMLDLIPQDKADLPSYMKSLAETDANHLTVYKFLQLQAAAFGGKQVWRQGPRWRHSGFRSYWKPKSDSVRRSVCNPMQPDRKELLRRVAAIASHAQGVAGVHDDIANFVTTSLFEPNCVIYIDPPYPGTESYGYDVDVLGLVRAIKKKTNADVYVSLDVPISDIAWRIDGVGPKGGISGKKKNRTEEWLSRF